MREPDQRTQRQGNATSIIVNSSTNAIVNHTMHQKPLMDHSSMSQVQTLTKNAGAQQYFDWCENTFAYVDQVRPGYEEVQRWVQRIVNLSDPMKQTFIRKSDFDKEFPDSIDWSEVNKDMWTLLSTKVDADLRQTI